jgi:intraflagellar transport protein 20
VEILERQSKVIERAKLRAIGKRNLVEAEPERRRRLEADLKALVDEKLAEQERLQAEFDSLSRVIAEQEELIERLTNAET